MADHQLTISGLTCEYRSQPLGMDVPAPRLSWLLESPRRGARQTAFQVTAAEDETQLERGEGLLWDSGKQISDQSVQVAYAGPALRSRQRVYWRVRVWDEENRASAWSSAAWFEMGLLEREDWTAKWIGHPLVGGPRTPVPSPFFRKQFSIDQAVRSARLYVSALGVYEVYLNGQRIGADVFSPGWTDYRQRVQYQVYDLSEWVGEGQQVLGAVLGDGWYCGNVEWRGRQLYGDRPKLLAQLEITLADGSRVSIASDESWLTATGPLLEADLIMGEAYDARLEEDDWSIAWKDDRTAGPGDWHWLPAQVFAAPEGMRLAAMSGPAVRAQEELSAVGEAQMAPAWPVNHWIFDFGQNLVGRVRLKVRGQRGQTLTLRFAEMLDEKGQLYTANLRTARQTDFYTLKGDPNGEIYESRFTFHGFRYVEVRGLSEKPTADLLRAVVLHSDNPPTGEFECSDGQLNQLMHNIRWGWKGNSVDIPTDCPQRDERLGWTGDGQVFARTATYLTQAAGFYTKWIQDLADAQLANGAIPATAPVTPILQKCDGGPAWSDAFIIVPWTLYQQYGDTQILARHYEAMRRYLDYLVTHSPGLIRMLPNTDELTDPNEDWQVGGYGDWLAQDGCVDKRGLTPRDLIGTAYMAYDARLMAIIAQAVDRVEDADQYDRLFELIRTAFIREFISADGLIASQTQTACLLALQFDLVPVHLRARVVQTLLEDLQARGMHMSTGFVGTPLINQVLTDLGHPDLAYVLLFQESFPSWLFSVVNGATTIWERWDSWTPEKGFQDPEMNSFNHYSYGAVGAWMFENILGIRSDPQSPGFKHIILQPRPHARLSFARGSYQCPYGMISSSWTREGDRLSWEVSVPPNTRATAFVPTEPGSLVLEGGKPASEAPGVRYLGEEGRFGLYELQPGSYQFTSEYHCEKVLV